jgi:hypothetical protein
MSHHLAELMTLATAEIDPDKKHKYDEQCISLIQRLWQSRDCLPANARPLGRIEEALKAFIAIEEDRKDAMAAVRNSESYQAPWITFMRNTYLAERRLFAIALMAGLLEAEFGSENQWIEQHKSQLAPDELKMIQLLDNWLQTRVYSFIGENGGKDVGAMTPQERDSAILEGLGKTVSALTESWERLKKEVSERRPKP